MSLRRFALFPCPWAVLLLLPLLIAAPARSDDGDVEQKKKDLLLRLRIHQAIDRGAVWVAGRQQPDGSFELEQEKQWGPGPQARHRFGESALALYTLAHCGYTPDRVEVRKGVPYLRKHYRAAMRGEYLVQASSYSLSLTVLALHTLYATDPAALKRDDRARYGNSVRAKKNPCQYPPWAQKMIREILDWLLENRSEKGLFRYPGGLGQRAGGGRPGRGRGPGMPGGGAGFMGSEDLSNTQYVLLALWVGSRCGYVIDLKTLRAIASRLLAWQEQDGRAFRRRPDLPEEKPGAGPAYANQDPVTTTPDRVRGFGYTPGAPPTGSMTTAGLSSLAIVKAMLTERGALDAALGARLDTGIWDAIAWLTFHYSIRENPPGGGGPWHYYYLYGLERACVIAGKKTLGDHDWYREGAELLVGAQKKDGRWAPGGFGGRWGGMGAPTTDLVDTCFALLFLKRAALEPREPILSRPVVTPTER